ncbi:MAG: hypothetical protein ABI467_03700 [Kofleriaceae bacterium]
MKLTKPQQRTAKKLAFPVIAMMMLTTMMALASAQRAQPQRPASALLAP